MTSRLVATFLRSTVPHQHCKRVASREGRRRPETCGCASAVRVSLDPGSCCALCRGLLSPSLLPLLPAGLACCAVWWHAIGTAAAGPRCCRARVTGLVRLPETRTTLLTSHETRAAVERCAPGDFSCFGGLYKHVHKMHNQVRFVCGALLHNVCDWTSSPIQACQRTTEQTSRDLRLGLSRLSPGRAGRAALPCRRPTPSRPCPRHLLCCAAAAPPPPPRTLPDGMARHVIGSSPRPTSRGAVPARQGSGLWPGSIELPQQLGLDRVALRCTLLPCLLQRCSKRRDDKCSPATALWLQAASC